MSRLSYFNMFDTWRNFDKRSEREKLSFYFVILWFENWHGQNIANCINIEDYYELYGIHISVKYLSGICKQNLWKKKQNDILIKRKPMVKWA